MILVKKTLGRKWLSQYCENPRKIVWRKRQNLEFCCILFGKIALSTFVACQQPGTSNPTPSDFSIQQIYLTTKPTLKCIFCVDTKDNPGVFVFCVFFWVPIVGQRKKNRISEGFSFPRNPLNHFLCVSTEGISVAKMSSKNIPADKVSLFHLPDSIAFV